MVGPAKGVVESSPGRAAEKLPAPPRLMSLLRWRSGSRSGRANIGRSPMFVFRRRITGGGAEPVDVAGEPSSPKVTCIGQVRMRNKNNRNKSKMKAGDEKKQQQRCSCRCICRSLFCKPYKPCRAAALWLWRLPFTCCRCWALPPLRFHDHRRYQQRRQSLGSDTTPLPPLPAAIVVPRFSVYSKNSVEYKDEEEEEEETTTPPKNALLLMRCRSTPHNRSSSLAARFWVSPIAESPAEADETATQCRQPEDEATEEDDERLVVGGESLESTTSSLSRTGKGDLNGSVHALILMRSKSESASKAAKLVVPEASFWYNPTTSGGRGFSAGTPAAIVHSSSPPLTSSS